MLRFLRVKKAIMFMAATFRRESRTSQAAIDRRQLEARQRVGQILQSYFGYGSCFRCNMPWMFTSHHDTKFSSRESCFPLCDLCFSQLGTAEARMPYYRMLYRNWLSFGPVDVSWPQIEAAVNAEFRLEVEAASRHY